MVWIESSADYTGMLATVINSLILQNSLEQKGIPTRVLSAIKWTLYVNLILEEEQLDT